MVATLHHIMIIDQRNLGTYFLMTHVLQQQFLFRFTRSCNKFLILKIFPFHFLRTCVLNIPISFCFDPWIFRYLLANLFSSFWLFLVLFLDAVNVGYCAWTVSCATLVANNNLLNNFYGIFFGVSDLGHTLLWWLTNLKTLAKKLLVVHPEKGMRRKKRKQLEWQLQSYLR